MKNKYSLIVLRNSQAIFVWKVMRSMTVFVYKLWELWYYLFMCCFEKAMWEMT